MIKKLLIPSDENLIEFVRIIKAKEPLYEYIFTRSIEKEGKTFTMTEKQIEENVRKGIFIVQ